MSEQMSQSLVEAFAKVHKLLSSIDSITIEQRNDILGAVLTYGDIAQKDANERS